jgi:hypothetical protein
MQFYFSRLPFRYGGARDGWRSGDAMGSIAGLFASDLPGVPLAQRCDCRRRHRHVADARALPAYQRHCATGLVDALQRTHPRMFYAVAWLFALEIANLFGDLRAFCSTQRLVRAFV